MVMEGFSSSRRVVILAIIIGLTIAVAVLELTTTHKSTVNGLRGSHAQADRESLKQQLSYVENSQSALALKLKQAQANLGAAEHQTETLLTELEDVEGNAQDVINQLEAELEQDEASIADKDKLLDEIVTIVEKDEAAIGQLQEENTDLSHELDQVEEQFEAAEETVVEVRSGG